MSRTQNNSWLYRSWRLYADGFKSLSPMAKTLWLIIIVKLFIMFAVLRPFFFPNHTRQQAQAHGISGSEWIQQDIIERANKDQPKP